ncbi:MAG TPA: hypothetical protein VFE23_21280 [Usitatibacter sp.]|jgi:hypothetical protein|nr:hypothetical protein [Usitatibacter sp.]
MRARVYPLRQRGRHTPRTEHPDGIEGDLTLQTMLLGTELRTVARLCAAPGRAAELLAPLQSPELVALGDGALLLRGSQSHDGVSYVQEWRCVLA